MKVKRNKFRDTKEDVEIQRDIRTRANYSLVVFGESFKRHGSGLPLNLIPVSKRTKKK